MKPERVALQKRPERASRTLGLRKATSASENLDPAVAWGDPFGPLAVTLGPITP